MARIQDKITIMALRTIITYREIIMTGSSILMIVKMISIFRQEEMKSINQFSAVINNMIKDRLTMISNTIQTSKIREIMEELKIVLTLETKANLIP
jgi:flagellar motor component MotA